MKPVRSTILQAVFSFYFFFFCKMAGSCYCFIIQDNCCTICHQPRLMFMQACSVLNPHSLLTPYLCMSLFSFSPFFSIFYIVAVTIIINNPSLNQGLPTNYSTHLSQGHKNQYKYIQQVSIKQLSEEMSLSF